MMKSQPKNVTTLIAKIKEHEHTTRATVDDMKARATRLLEAARNVEQSWSGSNFGYHWDLYFRDFQRPPLGHRFSVEWGGIHGLPPEWESRTPDDVKKRMEHLRGTVHQRLEEDDSKLVRSALDLQEEVLVEIQALALSQGVNDLAGPLKEIEQLKWDDDAAKDYLKHELNALPKMTRDSEAFAQGLRIPSHASYAATVAGIMAHCETLERFWKLSLRLFKNMEARAASKVGLLGPKLASNAKSPPMPRNVTLAWLFQNVTWRLWSSLAGILVTIIVAGVYLGQFGWVRDVFHAPAPTPEPTAESIKAQIDELTKGHNDRILQLQKGVIEEEQRAASQFDPMRNEHQKAAQKLRGDIKEEEESFRRSLDQLRSVRLPKTFSGHHAGEATPVPIPND